MSTRKVYLLGGHSTAFVGKGSPNFKKGQKGLGDFLRESIQGAFRNTGISAEIVDRTYVGNFVGECFNSQGHLGAAVADAEPSLMNKPSMRVEAACASGGLACSEAVRAIKAGDDCVLAVGVEVETEVDGRTGNAYLARAADFKRQSGIDDFLFPALFAKRTKAYIEKYPDVTLDDLAAVAVKAYTNGNRNPRAHMNNVRLSQEGAQNGPVFLMNEEYKPFIRMSDCSTFSDGSAAVIFMSEDGLRKHGISLGSVIEVIGFDQGAGDVWSDPPSLTEMTTARTVVSRLLTKAGLKPFDIQVAEVHDCFTITELMLYEAIGWADPGKGAEFFKSGATGLHGKIPVNTGGGLVATGHPVGATGVRQVLEVFRQMKGQCGDYQLARWPQLGLTVNMGGDDKTIAAMLFRNTPASKL